MGYPPVRGRRRSSLATDAAVPSDHAAVASGDSCVPRCGRRRLRRDPYGHRRSHQEQGGRRPFRRCLDRLCCVHSYRARAARPLGIELPASLISRAEWVFEQGIATHARRLAQCVSQLLALFGRNIRSRRNPVLGVKRTRQQRAAPPNRTNRSPMVNPRISRRSPPTTSFA